MTIEEATAKFPKGAAIARYEKTEEIAELMAFVTCRSRRGLKCSTQHGYALRKGTKA
jgi:hypothetical protein